MPIPTASSAAAGVGVAPHHVTRSASFPAALPSNIVVKHAPGSNGDERLMVFESEVIFGVNGSSCTDNSGTVKLKVSEVPSPVTFAVSCAAAGTYRLHSLIASVHGM
jgi:hypothetical protein